MLPTIYIQHDAKELIALLQKHLPLPLPLLQRFQFMNFPGGKTSHSCILTSINDDNNSNPEEDGFVAAYLDFSRGPETEMWLFSSLQEDTPQTYEQNQCCEMQLVALFHQAGEIKRDFDQTCSGTVVLGNVHEKVLDVLRRNHLVESASVPYLKFIFHVKPQSAVDIALPSLDFSWGSVRREDLALVISRTHIPRKEGTLSLLPSAAIFTTASNSPVAWGFLGPDGSLASLHCEEEYRGRGLAKAITLKLFQDHLLRFGPEKLAHADVALDNSQSQGVCKSLGGRACWIVYWASIRIGYEDKQSI